MEVVGFNFCEGGGIAGGKVNFVNLRASQTHVLLVQVAAGCSGEA